jgi:SAM-dependent methyltransferase
MGKTPYIIRGGIEGRERLRILSRVMQPTTLGLLKRVGIGPGMACLEVGCGSGDVAFDLARMVSPGGRVVATDIDQIKLELARSEAEAQQLSNIEFRLADITQDEPEQQFDLVHARFILTHLPNPDEALRKMRKALRRGGTIVVEDIDFQGYFCHPESMAIRRYVELYTQTVQRRGGDPNIGPRLPVLLTDAGFAAVQMNIVQPAGTTGEVKLISPITMENIAEAVIAEGLACQLEIDKLVADLYQFARSSGTIGCMPRVVEAWGYQTPETPYRWNSAPIS